MSATRRARGTRRGKSGSFPPFRGTSPRPDGMNGCRPTMGKVIAMPARRSKAAARTKSATRKKTAARKKTVAVRRPAGRKKTAARKAAVRNHDPEEGSGPEEAGRQESHNPEEDSGPEEAGRQESHNPEEGSDPEGHCEEGHSSCLVSGCVSARNDTCSSGRNAVRSHRDAESRIQADHASRAGRFHPYRLTSGRLPASRGRSSRGHPGQGEC